MDEFSFSVFPNENFLDLRLYQYGYEQCAPLHSFGPFVRNHYLFHYIISGQGTLDAEGANGAGRTYRLEAGHGFLICPGQVSTYSADARHPWKYVWLEFDGLRVAEYMDSAGLGVSQPVYRPQLPEQGAAVCDRMVYIADHHDASPLHLVGHLCLFLDGLIQSSSTRRAPPGGQLQDFYIQETIHFMERNYAREITVEEIAGVCKLNRSYFSKIFKASMGCPRRSF